MPMIAMGSVTHVSVVLPIVYLLGRRPESKLRKFKMVADGDGVDERTARNGGCDLGCLDGDKAIKVDEVS